MTGSLALNLGILCVSNRGSCKPRLSYKKFPLFLGNYTRNAVLPGSSIVQCQSVAGHPALSTLSTHHLHEGSSDADSILATIDAYSLQDLMAASANLRDAHRHPTDRAITFSPKVFIPLTQLCRDSCGYCTFAREPTPGRRVYMTLEEVLTVARLGAAQGCIEALFTLGDKPELYYPEAKAELEAMGLSSTIEYVAIAAEAVLKYTGLLPHINAGVMSEIELAKLKAVSVSQGLMLESTSRRLLEPGQAHYNCPDKDPELRLKTLEAAGRLSIPFTTGLLVGIGETRKERIEALLAIRDIHNRHGHIQEIIIQNFKAKKGTAMAEHLEPPLSELLWTIAVTRLLFGPDMSIQAPPNLAPEPDDSFPSTSDSNSSWRALIDAGINDFGGLSPITRDYVNPEKPWPHIQQLAAVTAESGRALVPRLPIYPSYISYNNISGDRKCWLDTSSGVLSPCAGVLRQADGLGLARASTWYAGATNDVDSGELMIPPEIDPSLMVMNTDDTKSSSTPIPRPRQSKLWQVSNDVNGIMTGCSSINTSSYITDLVDAVLSSTSYELTEQDITALFSVRAADYQAVCDAADRLRSRLNGDTVTYVVNRNINYTNICTYGCKFCAFSKGPASNEALRGAPYLLSLNEIKDRVREAWSRGATEVCMQGGIHPEFTGNTYLDIVKAVKEAVPKMHIHAFSPLEIAQGAATLGWSLERYLGALKEQGLGSLPGTAAEVLDDQVRAELCPDKLSTAEWLEVIETAHSVGLKTTSTIMFGHIDTPVSWARHLIALRDLQKRTRGISEFVPLPFVHMQAPIYKAGKARMGPTLRECVLMHAIARLALHPHITNIQASWVKMGPEQAAQLLQSGCNDMGGVLMNESITRAAGASHGQELCAEEMERLIREAGRVPMQRTTLYDRATRTLAV